MIDGLMTGKWDASLSEFAQNGLVIVGLAAMLNRTFTVTESQLRDITSATSTRAQTVRTEGSPPQLQLRGSPENIAEASKRIKALLKELAESVTEEVAIDRKYFPNLIGPRGSRVQELSKKHGDVTIRFSPPESKSDVVIIQGNAKHVAAAKADLLSAVAEQAKKQESRFRSEISLSASDARLLSACSRAVQAKYKVTIQVPPVTEDSKDSVSVAVVGQEGDVRAAETALKAGPLLKATVPVSATGRSIPGPRAREVSEAHGVQVTLPRSGEQGNVITIIGPAAAVQEAVTDVNNSVAQAGAGKADSGADNQVTEELLVEESLHPIIIGSRGATINGIRSDSGARINLSRGSDRIELRGSADQVASAKRLIMALVDERRAIKTATLVVDPRYYGTIIGPKGANLQQLQNEFDVRINVPSSRNGRGGVRGGRPAHGGGASDEIVIRGAEDKVAAAKEALLKVVEEEGKWTCSILVALLACEHQRQRRDDTTADPADAGGDDVGFDGDADAEEDAGSRSHGNGESALSSDAAFFALAPSSNGPKLVWGKASDH